MYVLPFFHHPGRKKISGVRIYSDDRQFFLAKDTVFGYIAFISVQCKDQLSEISIYYEGGETG
ncbi:MAG: hypothetical protein BWK80_30470 [Desulfobacteraceae bacterium IS3]|nr:MAG: hypothetical protein BWK80_30470 [Desulfobacteraceae bacterium IS3]